jgi:glycosyltransferase involved in cell wall biosynthesis
MKIIIANERLLFRFGVDRVLILLGTALKEAGHEVLVISNHYDLQTIKNFSSTIINVPVNEQDYLSQNEYTLNWLENNQKQPLSDFKADITLIGGWPFFLSIPFFNELGSKTIFMDCGAVPLEGLDEGSLLIQTRLRALRKQNLPKLSLIISISNFIANSQSIKDSLGQTPILNVLLAADHMERSIWEEKTSLKSLDKVKLLKIEGKKTIFSLGRWEPNNYKNSAAAFDILNLIRYSHPDTVLLVLGEKNTIEIPEYLRANVLCVGFPSDSELLSLMQLSDVGIIVSQWEGFNLPLAEMQWIKKPAFVFDLAAHPEVVVHPWFLCDNNEDMAKKISLTLGNKVNIFSSNLYEKFHEFFTWDRVVKDYKEIFEEIISTDTAIENYKTLLPYNKLQIIIDVSNSCQDPANSGVIRVTRRLSAEMQTLTEPVFVLWDKNCKQYVIPTLDEYFQLGAFHGPELKSNLPVSTNTQRVFLDDYLNEHPSQNRWLILAELFSENETIYIRKYAKTNNLRIAAIFYDAIPVLYPQFCNSEVKENHTNYMDGLSACDIVIPISNYSASCLNDFWNSRNIPGTEIITNELPGEFGGAERVLAIKEQAKKANILCVSTLEPRKNHKTLIKAIELLEKQHPSFDFKLTLIGNRYAGAFEIAEDIVRICRNNPRIEWPGSVNDNELIKAYKEADFTIYPSIIEGFGMPVLESIWYSKPCICSEEGTMGELAKDGGCLPVDILDAKELSKAIYQLATDKKLFSKLSNEAINRDIKNWKAYVEIFLGALISKSNISHSFSYDKVLSVINNKRVLICCNAYPPNFIGGAELIAHYQAKELQSQGFKVAVFAGDTADNSEHYHLKKENYDSIEVYRIKLQPGDFSDNHVNFSHKPVERVFQQLLADFKPSIVHMHNIVGLSVSLPSIAKDMGIKTVLTLHDGWGFCYKNTMMRDNGKFCHDFSDCSTCLPQLNDGSDRSIPLFMRQYYFALVMKSVDTFISPSFFLRDQYLKAGFDENNFTVLANGIDVEKFDSLKKTISSKLRFTFIGYFGEHKGAHLILEALALIKDKKNIIVNLVGDGHLNQTYKDYVTKQRLTRIVKFFGKVDNNDIPGVFAQTDVYILPSLWPENQPVSITEAFAAKVPVIGTDFGGIKELVENNKSGFLFPMGDVEALANKMQYFIDNQEKCLELGENAYAVIKPVNFKAQVAKLINLYAQHPYSSGTDLTRKSKPVFIVSCIGQHISSIAKETISKIKQFNPLVKFIMHEWIDGITDHSVDLIWVVDPKVTLDSINSLLTLQKPLLVPEENAELKNYCIINNSGLYYSHTDIAIGCINHLAHHKTDAFILGENQ